MYDDDRDALAAEYVLGTLSGDERAQAETLMTIDPAFEAVVHQWERRLGELNVMVEAVEPAPEIWEKIKASIRPVVSVADDELKLPRIDEAELQPAQAPEAPPTPETTPSPIATLASSLLPPEVEPPTQKPVEAPPVVPTAAPSPRAPERAEPKKVERSADVIQLERRVKRWRRVTLLLGALAAAMALYIAVWQVAPDFVPAGLRPADLATNAAQAPLRAQQDRLIVVLQQEPTAPAFLLTLDTQKRTMIVRRVSAAPETGRSYELWLISSRFPTPRSLGIVGNDEFTQRAFPANYDVNTLRTASYAISLEPAGGSTSGVPTGPVLFTGKAVDSLPGAPKT